MATIIRTNGTTEEVTPANREWLGSTRTPRSPQLPWLGESVNTS